MMLAMRAMSGLILLMKNQFPSEKRTRGIFRLVEGDSI